MPLKRVSFSTKNGLSLYGLSFGSRQLAKNIQVNSPLYPVFSPWFRLCPVGGLPYSLWGPAVLVEAHVLLQLLGGHFSLVLWASLPYCLCSCYSYFDFLTHQLNLQSWFEARAEGRGTPWQALGKILFRQVSSCPPCSQASRSKNPKTKISVLHKLFMNPDNSSKKFLDRTVEQCFFHWISVHMGRHAIAHGLYLIFWWGVFDRQWMCTPNPHYNLIL